MKIVRVAIRGFGALANVELPWPEGRLLLVVDPNESGKTTLCEAIVAGLYGLPHGRVAATRARERRRPRGGAPLGVTVDVEMAGRTLTAVRDLEAGTVRVTERETGADVTAEFLKGAGRDTFGERVTGLGEPLFRTTAYVEQNVLDGDELSKGLTLELARIADSGGGEATVVRALDVLETAEARMPEALSGPTVSVATEVLRLGKRVEEKRGELARRRELQAGASAAAADLVTKAEEAARLARRAALLEIATVEGERRQMASRLAAFDAERSARSGLEEEAERLGREAGGFTPEVLEALERLEKSRGSRPAALEKGRQELAEAERRDAAEASAADRDLGAFAALPADDRTRLDGLLSELESARRDEEEAEAAVAAAWRDLDAEGVAEDLRRLEELPAAEREFLAGCDEERHAFEMDGVRSDRRAAEAQTSAAMAVGERRGLVRRGRATLAAGALVALVAIALLSSKSLRTAGLVWLGAGLLVGGAGALVWWRASRHLLGEERRRREEEAAARRQAGEARRKLSELRTRLDRIARAAGFGEGPALARALRRIRLAEPKRAVLLGRTARRDAVRERIARLGEALASYRAALGEPLPGPDAVAELRSRLDGAARAFQELDVRAAARGADRDRLAREAAALGAVDAEIAALLQGAGVPARLPVSEGLLLAEGARAKRARRREILEIELPARPPAEAGEREKLARRAAHLAEERDRRLAELGAAEAELPAFATPEEARRAAEAARREASAADEVRRRAEKTLAGKMRDGGERAREAEEELADLEEGLRRALLYRDALREAREALTQAAARAYEDFRRALAEASREILASWDVPFVGLEFDERLAVTAALRDGRKAAPEEIATAFSTGAREQIHLTARLSALRYLGTGARGVPLLLDDPLVAADDGRFVAVMRFLIRHVLSERPVLVVSCHGWRHDELLARLAPEERERVFRASIRPSSSSIDGA